MTRQKTRGSARCKHELDAPTPRVKTRGPPRYQLFIESGRSEGARLVTGGADMPDGLDTDWYVQPTLFSDAHNDMRIARGRSSARC